MCYSEHKHKNAPVAALWDYAQAPMQKSPAKHGVTTKAGSMPFADRCEQELLYRRLRPHANLDNMPGLRIEQGSDVHD